MATGPLNTGVNLAALLGPELMGQIRGLFNNMPPPLSFIYTLQEIPSPSHPTPAPSVVDQGSGLTQTSTPIDTLSIGTSAEPRFYTTHLSPTVARAVEQATGTHSEAKNIFNDGMAALSSICPGAEQVMRSSIQSLSDSALTDEDEAKLPEFKFTDMIDTIGGMGPVGGLLSSLRDMLKNIGGTTMAELDENFGSVAKVMGIGARQTITTTMISLAMSNNNVTKVEELLCRGLDPNVKIRKDEWLVHQCKSPEMLEVLMAHGLDLSINQPLRKAPFKMFCLMIEEYGADPWPDYGRIIDPQKRVYLNRLLRKRRKSLRWHLGKTCLLPELRGIVIDYLLPHPLRVDARIFTAQRRLLRLLKTK